MSVEEWHALGSVIGLFAQLAFLIAVVIVLAIAFKRIAVLKQSLDSLHLKHAKMWCEMNMWRYSDACTCGFHHSGIDGC